ncbi:MAG: hypothetical protein ACFFE3_08620 [Candidatus Thorarchaeota archaeon]
MSKHRDVQTPSTVEAIRMASASVLGTSTGLGYPIGSAIGTGSMLEQHSETVAMNIAPLIFSVRDTLMSSEGLELLSVEWDLDRTPSPEVLPEQLVVAGGREGGVGSHVCVLSWEKGVVDPFKIDKYMKILSKKIADVESAVINNELNYELEGLAVLGDFADRLNSVLFVDMIDRRFQGSWDSLQVKPEHIDIDLVAKMKVADDFTLLPPGMKIIDRKSLDFSLPSYPDDKLVEHFKHRVLTPSAIETLTKVIPETGQDILKELNYYAYAVEEAEVVEGIITTLTEFLELSEISLSDIDSLKPRIDEFVKLLEETVNSLEHIVEQHLSSGKSLTIEDHKSSLIGNVATSDEFSGIKKKLSLELSERFLNSVTREFSESGEVRAWQLKSTLRHSIAYATRVTQYFSNELNQYLVINAARKAFSTALREFRQEALNEYLDPTDLTLFEKFYAEVEAQLNAAFSKELFEGARYQDFRQLMDVITRKMIDAFKEIDVWDLISFSDVAEIARRAITQNYAVPQGEGPLTDHGATLMSLLDEFETLGSDIIPDVADTILSKPLVRRIIDTMLKEQTNLIDELSVSVEGAAERPDEWKKEALEWVESFRRAIDETMTQPQALLTLLNSVHEIVGETVTPGSMANRAKFEADIREEKYQKLVQEWQTQLQLIKQENESIRENNAKRESLIAEKTQQYEAAMRAYETALQDYNSKLEEYRAATSAEDYLPGSIPPPPEEPSKPLPIDSHIHDIRNQYPVKEEKPEPPKPEPDPALKFYLELRDLLQNKLDHLKEREKGMEETFARRVLKLQAEGIGSASMIGINIGEEFIEHLMSSTVRSLGHLLPRISRVYLRDTKEEGLLYLVTYERHGNDMTVSVGSTFLR